MSSYYLKISARICSNHVPRQCSLKHELHNLVKKWMCPNACEFNECIYNDLFTSTIRYQWPSRIWSLPSGTAAKAVANPNHLGPWPPGCAPHPTESCRAVDWTVGLLSWAGVRLGRLVDVGCWMDSVEIDGIFGRVYLRTFEWDSRRFPVDDTRNRSRWNWSQVTGVSWIVCHWSFQKFDIRPWLEMRQGQSARRSRREHCMSKKLECAALQVSERRVANSA